MGDLVEVTLPPLVPGQAESWAALIELAESFGEDWMLVGGQLVFLRSPRRASSSSSSQVPRASLTDSSAMRQ